MHTRHQSTPIASRRLAKLRGVKDTLQSHAHIRITAEKQTKNCYSFYLSEHINAVAAQKTWQCKNVTILKTWEYKGNTKTWQRKNYKYKKFGIQNMAVQKCGC